MIIRLPTAKIRIGVPLAPLHGLITFCNYLSQQVSIIIQHLIFIIIKPSHLARNNRRLPNHPVA
ncbi:hypothetical protein FEM49_03301 (plasmid) [Lactiplantibacillus plantarum]|nr:hypothetical protein FEM49_03301 [Lactiplantibacillus plantarum]